jgi:hypothetical protein
VAGASPPQILELRPQRFNSLDFVEARDDQGQSGHRTRGFGHGILKALGVKLDGLQRAHLSRIITSSEHVNLFPYRPPASVIPIQKDSACTDFSGFSE